MHHSTTKQYVSWFKEEHRTKDHTAIRMERPTPLTKLEINHAHVKPGQCPYDVALINHHKSEAIMKSQRSKCMKDWRRSNADEVSEERRSYLDTQRQGYLLRSELKAFKLKNMTDSFTMIQEKEGNDFAGAWSSERKAYNNIMKMHEDRFDFRQLQISYRDARTQLMSLTYHELDTEMKKVKPTWNSYHDLLDQSIRDRNTIGEKNREIELLNERLLDLTIEKESLKQKLKKYEEAGDDSVNKKRKVED